MTLIVVGVNHKTAPIDIREKLFLTPTEQDLLLAELKNNPAVVEAFVVSTCNRTEIYINGLHTEMFFDYVIRLVSRIKKLAHHKNFTKYFYIYSERDAVRHLLRVSAGLDSLVIGEKQILGQIKAALERAREMTMFVKDFNILANIAVRTGKVAQTKTTISYGGSSISWAAMMWAEKTLGTLKDKTILIIGAGKMSELAIGQLNKKGAQKVYVMNRTSEKAFNLSKKFECIPSAFSEIKETLVEADVCICSVGAPHYILDKELLGKVMQARGGRELVLVDISMPRNIDPTVARLPNVQLSHIDDLNDVVQETMRIRHAAVGKVETIIEQKLKEYYRKLEKLRRGSPEFNVRSK